MVCTKNSCSTISTPVCQSVDMTSCGWKSLDRSVQKLTAPMRPASNSFRGFFWSPVCFLLPGTGASRTLVSSWDPPFRKGFCLGPAAGETAEEVEVVADESAMGADGKVGLVFWVHQALSPLGPLACNKMSNHSRIYSTR